MKRILAVLLLVMLLAAAVPATSLAAGAVSNGDSKVYHVKTNGGNLHLRAKPNDSSAILASLPNGTALIYKGKSGNWYKVRTANGMTGYVFKKYTGNYAKADVDTRESGLNVRSSRSAKGTKNILYSIPHGTKGVTVYKINGNWAYVNYSGNKKKGWASMAYLDWARW